MSPSGDAGKTTAGFEPVNLKTALAGPNGFYDELARTRVADRKVVLIRIPADLPTSVLDGQVLSGSGRRRPFSTLSFPHEGQGQNYHQYGLCKTEETPSVGLAVPSSAGTGLVIDRAFDELWVVKRLASSSAAAEAGDAQGAAELDLEGDVGGGQGKRVQPEGLRMGLSAVNLGSVIRREGKRQRRASCSEERSKTDKEGESPRHSPSKKKKNKKQDHQ